MRRFTMQVFDEYISGSGTWYTSCSYDELLGSADSILVQAVTEEVSGTVPGVVVQPQYSCNGLDWLNFNGSLITTITNDQSYLADSQFFNANVFLTYLKLKITLSGAAPACYLKLFVCGRASMSAPASPASPRVGSAGSSPQQVLTV